MLNVNVSGRGQALRAGLVASFLASVMLVSPVRATEKTFFFGDSISDTGNGCLLPFLGLADDLLSECRDARYFLGRTTQGPVWSEVLASNLTGTPLIGLPLNGLVGSIDVPFFPDEMAISSAPPAALALFGLLQESPLTELPLAAFSGGANLSFAGAETEDLIGPDPEAPALAALATQTGAFLALAGTLQPGPADLYVVWVGGNDIRRPIQDSEPLQIKLGVDRILATIEVLRATVGAQRFLVPNLPDVGLSLDLNEDDAELATTATKQWNEALDAGLARVDSADVMPLDALCLTEALIKFGRLDTERTCLEGNEYPGCRGVLLFDGIHATSEVHRSIGFAAQAALECNGEAWWPGRLRRCVARFTRVRVRQGLLAPEGKRAIDRCVGRMHSGQHGDTVWHE